MSGELSEALTQAQLYERALVQIRNVLISALPPDHYDTAIFAILDTVGINARLALYHNREMAREARQS
jgi:2-methylcitrate dehydratase PrpD